MTDYLERAIEYLDVDEGSILSHRQYETEIAVVVDKGIAGCPKYVIPLSELAEQQKPLLIDPVEDYGEPAAVDLNALSYRELQSMARDADIPATGGKKVLIAALQDALDGD